MVSVAQLVEHEKNAWISDLARLDTEPNFRVFSTVNRVVVGSSPTGDPEFVKCRAEVLGGYLLDYAGSSPAFALWRKLAEMERPSLRRSPCPV